MTTMTRHLRQPTRPMVCAPFLTGFQAYAEGLGLMDNPYQPGDENACAWLAGWECGLEWECKSGHRHMTVSAKATGQTPAEQWAADPQPGPIMDAVTDGLANDLGREPC